MRVRFEKPRIREESDQIGQVAFIKLAFLILHSQNLKTQARLFEEECIYNLSLKRRRLTKDSDLEFALKNTKKPGIFCMKAASPF